MRRLLYIVFITFLSVSCNIENTDSDSNSKKARPSVNVPTDGPVDSRPQVKPECFQDYRILKGSKNNWNYLAFKNFGHRGIGKCRGHAIVGQKFSELASFKDNGRCSMSPLTDECKAHINKGINSIINFNPYTFNGFANLYDFSSHPYVSEQLKLQVKKVSHKYSAGRANIRNFDANKIKQSIFNEIVLRIKENQQPYIGVKGENLGHHAIVGYALDYFDGHEVICIRDSNIINDTVGEECQNFLYIDEGEVYYKRFNQIDSKLYIFSLTSDEDKRVLNYIKGQYNNCVSSTL